MIGITAIPGIMYYPLARTSSETSGSTAIVEEEFSFEVLRNATWFPRLYPMASWINLETQKEALTSRRIKASDLGWTGAQVASLKARQASFRDEWNAPGMEKCG